MISDTRPVFGFAEQLAYLLIAELCKYAPHKHLSVRVGNRAQDFPRPHCLITLQYLLFGVSLKGGQIEENGIIDAIRPSGFFEISIIAVFCYLTQPNADVALAAKAFYRTHGLIESFARDILGYILAARKSFDIKKHIVEIIAVYFFKLRHSAASFHI
jgi:hypothetical protein